MDPGFNGDWNGDVYKALLFIRAREPKLDAFVLDCDYGLGIVRVQPPVNRLRITDQAISNMDYSKFSENRKELLDLRPPEALDDLLILNASKGPPC